MFSTMTDRDKATMAKQIEHAFNNPFRHVEQKQHGRLSPHLNTPEKIAAFLQAYGDDVICPKCERRALCDQAEDEYTCPSCMWHGNIDETMTVREFFVKRMFR